VTAPGGAPGPALPRLSIARDGSWRHEGQEITHERLLAYLWESLRVDAAGHFVRSGALRVPVEVEDAPFVVLRVELADGAPAVILSDGSREPLAVDTLRFGPGDVPYCHVKRGAFIARLSRAAAWQLLQRVEADEATGQLVLALADARHPIAGLGSR
jgi:hypothetical protein